MTGLKGVTKIDMWPTFRAKMVYFGNFWRLEKNFLQKNPKNSKKRCYQIRHFLKKNSKISFERSPKINFILFRKKFLVGPWINPVLSPQILPLQNSTIPSLAPYSSFQTGFWKSFSSEKILLFGPLKADSNPRFFRKKRHSKK